MRANPITNPANQGARIFEKIQLIKLQYLNVYQLFHAPIVVSYKYYTNPYITFRMVNFEGDLKKSQIAFTNIQFSNVSQTLS